MQMIVLSIPLRALYGTIRPIYYLFVTAAAGSMSPLRETKDLVD